MLVHLPGTGIGDKDQVFNGPVQAELVQERGRRCREVVLNQPPAVGVGRADVVACARPCAGGRRRSSRDLDQVHPRLHAYIVEQADRLTISDCTVAPGRQNYQDLLFMSGIDAGEL